MNKVSTCLYPERHPVTGAFCHEIASEVVIDGRTWRLCPHHIGVMRGVSA